MLSCCFGGVCIPISAIIPLIIWSLQWLLRHLTLKGYNAWPKSVTNWLMTNLQSVVPSSSSSCVCCPESSKNKTKYSSSSPGTSSTSKGSTTASESLSSWLSSKSSQQHCVNKPNSETNDSSLLRSIESDEEWIQLWQDLILETNSCGFDSDSPSGPVVGPEEDHPKNHLTPAHSTQRRRRQKTQRIPPLLTPPAAVITPATTGIGGPTATAVSRDTAHTKTSTTTTTTIDTTRCGRGTRVVVVQMTAPWCQPCHDLQPALENLAQSYVVAHVALTNGSNKKGEVDNKDPVVDLNHHFPRCRISFVRVNIEDWPTLAQQYQVWTLPTTLVFTTATSKGDADDHDDAGAGDHDSNNSKSSIYNAASGHCRCFPRLRLLGRTTGSSITKIQAVIDAAVIEVQTMQ